MESLGLRCGQSLSFRKCEIGLMEEGKSQTSNSLRPCHTHHRIKPIQSCATNAAIASPSSFSSPLARRWGLKHQEQENANANAMPPEKLDQWMRDSVTEIVRNIAEAPFLVHVYSSAATNNNTRLELEREEATADSWPSITRRWKQGCPIPDGVILVEQLDHQKTLQLVDGDQDQQQEAPPDATGTKTWGLLIQGKGADTAACYILKTCRVSSSLGYCTHFCLLKANCFGETAQLQLQNSWNGIDN